MRWTRIALAGAAALALAAPASATTYQVQVLLTGANERPTPVGTEGFGTATVTFDDQTGAMSVTGDFFALSSNANNAHVHGYAPQGNPGDAGTTGPPVFGLTFTAAMFGAFSGSGTVPSDRIDDVLAGLTYINVHSVNFPAGEIRGQIVVPEPTSALLGGLGLAGLARFGRRRAA
jgi:hypothetical protein